MTLQLTPQPFLFPEPWTIAASAQSGNLNGATAKIGFVFQVEKSGTLSKVMASCVTGLATSVALLQVETVSAGLSTGTLIGAGASGTFVPANATAHEVTLATPQTVTKGQLLAITVQFTTYVSGSASFLRYLSSAIGQQTALPYSTQKNSGGSDAKDPLTTTAHAVMIDGVWVFHYLVWPAKAFTRPTFSSSTTPDEVGNKFTLLTPARACGVWFSAPPTATSFTAQIYDASDAVIASATFADTTNLSGATNKVMPVQFDANVDLAAGTVYRVTVKPTSATAITIPQMDLPSTAYNVAMPDGGLWQKTSRKSAGAWTDVSTSRMAVGLMLNAFDSGGSASNRKLMTSSGLVPA